MKQGQEKLDLTLLSASGARRGQHESIWCCNDENLLASVFCISSCHKHKCWKTVFTAGTGEARGCEARSLIAADARSGDLAKGFRFTSLLYNYDGYVIDG